MEDQYRIVTRSKGKGRNKRQVYRLEMMGTLDFKWWVFVPEQESLEQLADSARIFFRLDISKYPVVKE